MDKGRRRVTEESGATSAEYALMVGLILLLIVVAVTSIGTSLSAFFTNAANGIVGS